MEVWLPKTCEESAAVSLLGKELWFFELRLCQEAVCLLNTLSNYGFKVLLYVSSWYGFPFEDTLSYQYTKKT